MDGLVAVTSAFGLQLDQLIRDLGGGQLVQGIFQFANSVAMAEGAAGDLAGVLTAVVSALTGYIGAVKLGLVSSGALTGALGTLSGWLGTLASGFTTLVSGLASVVSGSISLAIGLGALIGTLGVVALEVTGVLDAVQGFGRWVGNQLPASVRDGIMALSSIFIGGLATVGAVILGFVRGTLEGGLSEGIDRALTLGSRVINMFIGSWERTLDRVTNTVTTWVDGAVEWGENIIENIVQGIRNKADQLARTVEREIAQPIDDRLPSSPAKTGPLSNIDQSGPGLVNTFAQGISGNTSTVANAANDMAGSVGTGGSVSSPLRENRIYMDGRDVTAENGRYRRDETSRRGRNG